MSGLVSILEPAEDAPASTSAGVAHPMEYDNADLARLADVFRRDADWVLRILRRFGAEASDADDLVQEVFLVLRARLGEVRPGEERGFLFRTAGYLASNARRNAQRRSAKVAENLRASMLQDAEDRLAKRDELAQLQSILNAMPDDLRDVFVLFEIEEMTFPEISKIVGLPIGTAKSRLLRARQVFHEEARKRGLGQPEPADPKMPQRRAPS